MPPAVARRSTAGSPIELGPKGQAGIGHQAQGGYGPLEAAGVVKVALDAFCRARQPLCVIPWPVLEAVPR